MPLLSTEMLTKHWDNPAIRRRVQDSVRNVNYVAASPASVVEVVQSLRHALVDRQAQLHKSCRPWEIFPDVLDSLNRAQPWWGWEFETGWSSQQARGQALAFTYDNFDGVMYDGEGEGNWPVEITFLPQSLGKAK